MYECGFVVRQNITGNDEGPTPTEFASTPNRNHTLDTVAGLNNYGDNGGFEFSEPSLNVPHIETDAVLQFNSRLDLENDLPSTQNVHRYVVQNK